MAELSTDLGALPQAMLPRACGALRTYKLYERYKLHERYKLYERYKLHERYKLYERYKLS
jgi:hypothetical protein